MTETTKADVISALSMLKPAWAGPGQEMHARIAAARIVAALTPSMMVNAGSEFYRIKAEDWLALLLAAEPGMSLETLAAQVSALSAVSDGVKRELAGLAGRLAALAS